MSLLSDARLNRDYASKIIHAISLSSDPAPGPLILRYVRTAKPLLIEPDDLYTYTIALAESSLLEVWQWQRTFSEGSEHRGKLLEKIFEWCVSRMLQSSHLICHYHDLCGCTAKPRPHALTQLLSFPFSPFEQKLLQSYAAQNPSHEISSASLAILQDLVCVRLIQGGKYADAIKMDRLFSSNPYHQTPTAESRKTMMQELYASLPSVERIVLDAQLESEKALANNLDDPNALKHLSHHVIPPATSRTSLNMHSEVTNAKPKPSPSLPDTSRFLDISLPLIPISGPSNGMQYGRPIVTSSSSPLASNGYAPRTNLPLSLSSSGRRVSFPPSVPRSAGRPTVQPTIPSPSAHVPFISANSVANAFYQPPPPRPQQPGLLSGMDVDAIFGGGKKIQTKAKANANNTDGETNMDSEDEVALRLRLGRNARQGAEEADADDGPELSQSIFSKPNANPRRSEDAAPVERSVEPEGSMPWLPGAFVDQNDDQEQGRAKAPVVERTPPRRPTINTRKRSAPPSPPPVKQTRAHKSELESLRKSGLGRSLPGTLMDDEDDGDDENDLEQEEQEENDYLAPLPEVPARKSRTSRGSSVGSDSEGNEAPRRRSSRLSSAPPSSPEASPPKKLPLKKTKPRKITKTDATGKKSTGAGTRKKR